MTTPGFPWVPATRIPRGASGAKVSWQTIDADGEPAAATGTVTVAVTTSDGTSVTPGSVSTDSETFTHSASLPASAVAAVDWLTVTWSVDAVETFVETVEVCGGTLGNFAQITDGDATTARRDTGDIRRERKAVEDIVTNVTCRSPFERFYVERLSGTGRHRLALSWPDTLEVIWAREYESDGTTTEDYTADELAAIAVAPGGVITRRDGGTFTKGDRNLEFGYRWGWAGGMPHDLRLDLYRAIRARVASKTTGHITDRATAMTTADGTDYTLATPGLGPFTTGLPDVDEKLNRYRFNGRDLG